MAIRSWSMSALPLHGCAEDAPVTTLRLGMGLPAAAPR